MSSQSSHSETAPILTEKTPTVEYRKRYDQVSWRSADTDFETDTASNTGHDGCSRDVKKGCCASMLCSKRGRKLWALVLVVLVFLIIMISLIYLYYSKPNLVTPTQPVTTDCGPVEGVVVEIEHSGATTEVNVFKGIPYARPPIGELRWKPPERRVPGAGCWRDVLKAHTFGSKCAQGKGEGSEDCLYLNVYTPNLKGEEKLPVFVWLHGGYLMKGSGNGYPYSPGAELSLQMEAVVVTVNFRLNVFGFLTLQELWEPGVSYGNYGLRDQIMALQWVQRNIGNFRGDAGRVTLCGHNGGGSSVLALLVSPLASGLFQNAISMSGLPRITRSYSDAAIMNRRWINETSCRNASSEALKDCLYNLPTNAISDTIPYFDYFKSYGYSNEYIPSHLLDFPFKSSEWEQQQGSLIVIDPIVLPRSPSQQQPSSKHNNPVSVLLGSTAQEIGLAAMGTFMGSEDFPIYTEYLQQRLDKFAPNLTSTVLDTLYPTTCSNIKDLRTECLHETIASDVRAVCPTNKLAAVFAAQPRRYRVFRYVVAHTPHTPINIFHFPAQFAFHMWDMMTLFDFAILRGSDSVSSNMKVYIDPFGLKEYSDGSIVEVEYIPSASDLKFKHTLHGNFKHFVNFGHMLDGDWGRGGTAVFNKNGTLDVLKGSYHEEQCAFWNDPKKGFVDYAWSD